MNIKLYLLSFADISLIIASLFSDIDLDIKRSAAIIGIVVGILTTLKLWQDIKIRKLDRKIKEKKLEILDEE